MREVAKNKSFCRGSRDCIDVKSSYAEKRVCNGDKKNSSGDNGSKRLRELQQQEVAENEDSDHVGMFKCRICRPEQSTFARNANQTARQ